MNRDIYSVIAAILPALLGLGLIDLYISRDVSFATIVACVIGLAILMIVIAALSDVAQAMRQPRRRRRRARIDP
jgi:hypothetical protein